MHRGPHNVGGGGGRLNLARRDQKSQHTRGLVAVANAPWAVRSSNGDSMMNGGQGSSQGGYGRQETLWDGSVMFRFGDEFIAPLEEVLARQQQAQAQAQQQQQGAYLQQQQQQQQQGYFIPAGESPMDPAVAMNLQQMQYEQQQQQQQMYQQQQAAMYQAQAQQMQQVQAQQQAAALYQQQAQAQVQQAQAQAHAQAQQAQAQAQAQMMKQQRAPQQKQPQTRGEGASQNAPRNGERQGNQGRRSQEAGGRGASRPSNALTIMSSIGASGEITWDARRGGASELAELFAALSEHGYVKEALRLLQDLAAGGRRDVLPMLRHKPFLRAAEHQGAVEAALSFLDLMPPDLVDNRTFNMVVSVCVGSKSLHGAFKVLGQMRERGLKPDLILYTNMITVSARCGDAERAFELYQQMRAEGIRPCPMAFGSLISACSQEILQLGPRAKRRQLVLLERAFSVLEEMSRAHIPPDLALFNALLSACGRAGEIQRLRDVYSLMQSRGYVPDVATYGTIVSTLARAGRPEEALEMFQHAIQQGRAGSVRLWGAAVEACGDLGPRGGAKAKEIYNQMRSIGMSADAQLYGALIRVAGRAGDVDMAFQAFEEMKQSGSEPSREARSILLLAAVQAGHRERAWEILDELARTHGLSGQSDPSGPPLTVEPCNALLASYAKEGRLDQVAEVIRRMCRLGMKADQFTFAGIFQACLAAEEGDLSLDLYRAMRRQGLPLDDVTLSALLRICAKEAGNTRALYGQGKGSRPRAVMSAAGAQLLDLLGGGEASSVATPNMISGQSIGEDWSTSALAILRDGLQHGVKPQLVFIDKVISCLRVARTSPPPSAPDSPHSPAHLDTDLRPYGSEDAAEHSESGSDSDSERVATNATTTSPARGRARGRKETPSKGRKKRGLSPPASAPSGWTASSGALAAGGKVQSPMLTALAMDDESSFDPRALTLVEESIKLGMCPGFFLDKGDQTIDLRLMPPAVAEVYIMVLGNAIRAHCAGPGPLGGKRFYNNITLLVPSYNPRAVMLPSGIQQKDGVVPIATEDRGSATALGVAAMLRRIKLWYTALPEDGQLILGGEQINNWLRSTTRKMSQAAGLEAEASGFLSPQTGLGKGIVGQQRSIRTAF